MPKVGVFCAPLVAMLLARVVDKVKDWDVAMMKVVLLTWVVARVVTKVQDCVAAMMNREQLTRVVEMSMLATWMEKMMLDLAILVEKLVVVW